jgi:hypothetical protein
MRLYIEITRHSNGTYSGLRHEGKPQVVATHLHKLAIGSDDQICIKDKDYRIGDLLQALLQYQAADLAIAYDERGQLEIGQYLYKQVFGALDPSDLRSGDEPVDVRIICDDEHASMLPWVLLAHQGIFLCATGWSITLAGGVAHQEFRLPEQPTVLIVAPQPKGAEPTEADTHLQKLRARLSALFPHFVKDDYWRVCVSWEDFVGLPADFSADIVYYYGHGIADDFTARLVFATGPTGSRVDKPIADFAQKLRTCPQPPLLVYLNCCKGGAGGFLGAGRQLGKFIPAVVTNRTFAEIDAAQAQASMFLESSLLQGAAPHLALTRVLGQMPNIKLSFDNPRWMTPVAYCSYDTWIAKPPSKKDPFENEPFWHLTLDRDPQFGKVSIDTHAMLDNRRPKALGIIWYGASGQGVESFHNRVEVFLRREMLSKGNHYFEVIPAWPMADPRGNNAFYESMLCEAFHVQSFAHVPEAIRNQTLGASGVKTLVCIRHEPAKSKRILDTETLGDYLHWFDKQFVPALSENVFCILTMSFIREDPADFGAALDEIDWDGVGFNGIMPLVLDEIGAIKNRELMEFVRRHDLPILPAVRKQVLDEILSKTAGQYDRIIEEFKTLFQ